MGWGKVRTASSTAGGKAPPPMMRHSVRRSSERSWGTRSVSATWAGVRAAKSGASCSPAYGWSDGVRSSVCSPPAIARTSIICPATNCSGRHSSAVLPCCSPRACSVVSALCHMRTFSASKGLGSPVLPEVWSVRVGEGLHQRALKLAASRANALCAAWPYHRRSPSMQRGAASKFCTKSCPVPSPCGMRGGASGVACASAVAAVHWAMALRPTLLSSALVTQ